MTRETLSRSARDLEEEQRAPALAPLDDVETPGSTVQALDRLLSAILASLTLDELLHGLLQILVDVARADVAVLRLREGDRLRSRAAIGLEEEVAAGFSLTLDEALPPEVRSAAAPLVFAAVGAESPCTSEVVKRKGVRALYCLPLSTGDGRAADSLVGAVYLGTRLSRELTDDQKHLLRLLIPRAALAVARQAERDALREDLRSRDEVLGVVAHDLRNPISVIALAATTLLHRLPDSSARRPVERIVRGAQRADRLIHDLLEVSALEGGRFSTNPRKVEVADIILAAIESQQSLAADASIIISADLFPDLPSIQADEERILEVLENLVGNAIKFTGPAGTVTVGASAREGEILFWVKDSGAGISPEDVPHLFDRFWQARKKDRRGTGLGLTICRGIVEAHGGRIWPETKAGVGTTMFFTVPAIARPAVAARTNQVANILLVDDRSENLLSLRAILERPEYRLVTAESGPEALSLALRESFAVALIDIAMPGMNGLEVAVHLKDLERSRDIPIIFVTAFGDDPQEIHRAYSAGGADYLVKPLDAEIVRQKVAVFVDLSRRREAGGNSESERVPTA
jgi:signal transduction histidine kinase/ActR/RegA family two-component response regulator